MSFLPQTLNCRVLKQKVASYKTLTEKVLSDTISISEKVKATELLASLTNLKGGRCTDKNPCMGSCGDAVREQAIELVEAFLSSLTTQVEELEKMQKIQGR